MTVNTNTNLSTLPFAPAIRTAQAEAQAAPAVPVDSKGAPAENRKSIFDAAKQGAHRTAAAWAEDVGNVGAGIGGLTLMTLGLYGGVIGGALAGGILGGGFAGPVASALSSGGAWNFLSTGLSTVGAVGKGGMILGGLAGMAGGWRAGSKLGEVAAKPVPYLLGLAPGAVKGTIDHLRDEAGVPARQRPVEEREERPEVPEKAKGAVKLAGQILGGGALLAGLAGGGAIGAGIATGASLTQGLIASNLNFTALAGSAAVGAGIGAVVFGGILFVGGMTIVEGLSKGVREIRYRFAQGREYIEQGKKEAALDKIEKDVEKSEKDLATEKAAAERNQAERSQAVSNRDQGVAQVRARTAELTTNEESLVLGRTDELYDGKKKELGDFETFLDNRKSHLDSENARITQKEADVPGLTREEATRRRETHRAQNQGEYDRRKAGLENREGNLKGQEQAIPQTVQGMVEKELQPLRNERDRLLQEARNDRSEASRLDGQASADNMRVPILLGQASSDRSRANSVESENSRLGSEVSSLRSTVSSKESELSRIRREREDRERREREQREAEDRRRRQEEEDRRRRDDSNHGGGHGRRDDSNYGGGHGRREESRY